jgi:IS30 family transposase
VYKRWSPQQIAATLRMMHPDDASQWISHGTIYSAINAHPRGALKKGLVDVRLHRDVLQPDPPPWFRWRRVTCRG